MGFLCFVEEEDASIADTFYDFTVLSNRTVQIECAEEANPSYADKITEGLYNVMVTNNGILMTSQDNPKDGLNGNYYQSEIQSPTWEGAWASPFDDYQSDGLSRYYFDSFKNGVCRSSERTFSSNSEVDHSKLLKYFEESRDSYRMNYTELEGGLIRCSGICFWPVYVTDELWLNGCSGGANVLPEYWVPKYKLDIT